MYDDVTRLYDDVTRLYDDVQNLPQVIDSFYIVCMVEMSDRYRMYCVYSGDR